VTSEILDDSVDSLLNDVTLRRERLTNFEDNCGQKIRTIRGKEMKDIEKLLHSASEEDTEDDWANSHMQLIYKCPYCWLTFIVVTKLPGKWFDSPEGKRAQPRCPKCGNVTDNMQEFIMVPTSFSIFIEVLKDLAIVISDEIAGHRRWKSWIRKLR
jgi:hypothetical protein